MNRPLKSWMILNSMIVLILMIGWWAENQTPYELIRSNSRHNKSIYELKDRLASSTTLDEIRLVASQAVHLSGRLDGQIGFLSMIIDGQQMFLRQYWWVLVWFLVSNGFLVLGMEERRSAGLDAELVAEKEFGCRLLPMFLASSFLFLLMAIWDGISLKTEDLVPFFCGLTVVLVLIAILERYFKVSVNPSGFRSYQLGGSFSWVRWEDIESVRPIWLPFGLRYLRVFFKGSPRPVWLPLYMVDLEGFRLYVFQYLLDDNPLRKHLAGIPR